MSWTNEIDQSGFSVYTLLYHYTVSGTLIISIMDRNCITSQSIKDIRNVLQLKHVHFRWHKSYKWDALIIVMTSKWVHAIAFGWQVLSVTTWAGNLPIQADSWKTANKVWSYCKAYSKERSGPTILPPSGKNILKFLSGTYHRFTNEYRVQINFTYLETNNLRFMLWAELIF